MPGALCLLPGIGLAVAWAGRRGASPRAIRRRRRADASSARGPLLRLLRKHWRSRRESFTSVTRRRDAYYRDRTRAPSATHAFTTLCNLRALNRSYLAAGATDSGLAEGTRARPIRRARDPAAGVPLLAPASASLLSGVVKRSG